MGRERIRVLGVGGAADEVVVDTRLTTEELERERRLRQSPVGARRELRKRDPLGHGNRLNKPVPPKDPDSEKG